MRSSKSQGAFGTSALYPKWWGGRSPPPRADKKPANSGPRGFSPFPGDGTPRASYEAAPMGRRKPDKSRPSPRSRGPGGPSPARRGVEGLLSMNPRGFGFVAGGAGQDDVYVPPDA